MRWLERANAVEDYLEPAYYEQLLKEYRFDGKSDLELFADYCVERPGSVRRALELGAGTGRATSVFFLIHFDSLSEEQRILMAQWKKVFPIFNATDSQSPSLRITEEIFREFEQRGTIALSFRQEVGEPIRYASLDEALEILMNFHLETYFNHSPLRDSVLAELRTYCSERQAADGSISITPGCLIITGEKVS